MWLFSRVFLIFKSRRMEGVGTAVQFEATWVFTTLLITAVLSLSFYRLFRTRRFFIVIVSFRTVLRTFDSKTDYNKWVTACPLTWQLSRCRTFSSVF